MGIGTSFALLVTLAAGFGLGWLVHAARVGDRTSLTALNADAARQHSAQIGDQVSTLLDPLGAALHELTEHLQHIEQTRTGAYAALREQVASMQQASQHLSAQTGHLVSALRNPNVRGLWGEVALQRVAELAGMSQHCDFSTQVSNGGVRPDMVVRLAGGRSIVVDAKVPMAAYLDAANAPDDLTAGKHLRQHAARLRAHVEQLAAKTYWESFSPAPEFVVLFLPGEALLDAALASDPELFEHAFSRNVILTTPATLIALLRTVALTWRQDALTREVATVQRLGQELYTRLGVAGKHLDSLGVQLGNAVDSFNRTVASMESRVFVTARKLHELDLGTAAPEPVRQVESQARAVALDRLVDGLAS